MPIDDLLRERRLIVCVGPGGVGKTTAAAGLAARAAELGRRALVMTIDPARRLADVLSLDGLDDDFQRVNMPGADGELYAAMLDTKSSFDALIARVCLDPAERLAIMENRIYVAFSKTTERAHAYIAMERLYDALGDPRFDLIILDTPPAENALEILDSSGRLVRFLNSRTLRWLLRWGPKQGGRFGGVTRLFSRAMGAGLLTEIVSFLRLFAALSPGFERRARASSDALRSADTAFFLVTRPRALTLEATGRMWRQLAERGVAPELVIFNRSGVVLNELKKSEDEAVKDSKFNEIGESVRRWCAALEGRGELQRAAARDWSRGQPTRSKTVFLPTFPPGELVLEELAAIVSPHDGFRAIL